MSACCHYGPRAGSPVKKLLEWVPVSIETPSRWLVLHGIWGNVGGNSVIVKATICLS